MASSLKAVIFMRFWGKNKSSARYTLIAKDIDYYKNHFGRYSWTRAIPPTYNIAELITGSAKLTHALHDPPPGTYIFVNSISHLPKITASKTSFLVYSCEDNTTYQATYDSGSRKLEKITKGVVV
jgi:hypothetical protein